MRAVEQLAGAVAARPAPWRRWCCPAGSVGYTPALLDELTASGEVLWRGHGALPGDDGWVSLHLADTAHLTLLEPSAELELTEAHRDVLDALAAAARTSSARSSDAVGSTDDQAPHARRSGTSSGPGRVSNDTLAPLRALLAGGRTAHKRTPAGTARHALLPAGAARRWARCPGAARAPAGRRCRPAAVHPPRPGAGRCCPPVETDPTVRAYATAEVLLDRYGVVTRGSVVAEGVPGGFAGVYRVLAAAEESGRVRRGYFVEGLGAAQFATDRRRRPAPGPEPPLPGSATRTWTCRPRPDSRDDPARARHGPGPGRGAGRLRPGQRLRRGPALAGARRRGGRSPPRPQGRRAGRARRRGLTLYVERGGKTLLSWTDDAGAAAAAADALALAVREGALGRLTVEKADGGAVLGSDHPLAAALAEAGFHATPRGLRLRR